MYFLTAYHNIYRMHDNSCSHSITASLQLQRIHNQQRTNRHIDLQSSVFAASTRIFLVVSHDSIRWCVRLSIGPSVRPSVGPSVRPSVTRFFWSTKNVQNRARSGRRSIRTARRAEIRRLTTSVVYTNLF